MSLKMIVDRVLGLKITQDELGNYLGVTRQTVAKIKDGEGYTHLNSKPKEKLLNLENRTDDEIKKILKISSSLDEMKEMIIKQDSQYIRAAFEGIDYMDYWLIKEKFKDNQKYHKYYFGHMNNFYPRYNQAALFMRDTMNRQVYPLLTIQIDYNNNLVTAACLKDFKEANRHPKYDLSDIKFPLTFKDFYELLKERVKPKLRFLFYKDYLDDEWEYFVKNLEIEKPAEEQQISKFSETIFDLSRLLNFLDNDQPYYGPLLEDALTQFNIRFKQDQLLTNCHYRAEKIVKLINMISLQGLFEKKRDNSSRLFDGHGQNRDITFQSKERRQQKMNNLIKEKKK